MIVRGYVCVHSTKVWEQREREKPNVVRFYLSSKYSWCEFPEKLESHDICTLAQGQNMYRLCYEWKEFMLHKIKTGRAWRLRIQDTVGVNHGCLPLKEGFDGIRKKRFLFRCDQPKRVKHIYDYCCTIISTVILIPRWLRDPRFESG